ncbi:large ribosomal subunit protein mL38-like [Lytechinus pictus]|uniref:large ribosomal subunit protein mL38-like n=1 Tax=Lytechinus pictus TaxID=7653 RepID=UPI0030B9E45D
MACFVSCMQRTAYLNRGLISVRTVVTSHNFLSQNASHGVDIGLAAPHRQRRIIRRSRASAIRDCRSQAQLEAEARHRTLKIPLDQVKEVWEETSGPYHIRDVASHYGIFKDLFDGASFVPYVPLSISYSQTSGEHVPVFRGNIVTPSESARAPDVNYSASDDSLWTLLLTNPDGHLQDNNAEYVHWLIGNIPGNRIGEGETLVDYLTPFPVRGTGYHRLIFILFKQQSRISFDEEQQQMPCHSLSGRTFKTLDFYVKHQDVITPAGLGFFQSRWDQSVQQTFHQTLRMREPVFEYDAPKQYIAPQQKWPHRKPIHYLKKFLPKD